MSREKKSPEEAKSLLSKHGLRARKSLGQHFITDEQILQRIVSAARLTPEDTVIEIGPGLGALTLALARQAKNVIAVEADKKLSASLGKILEDSPNVRVICSDILQTAPASLSASTGFNLETPAYKVVANIPYYITGPILRHFLEASLKPSLMVLMIQKEVAESIVAGPGNMSLLAVSVQFYGKPEIVDYVPAERFYPPPKVDSAILQIELYEQPPVQVPDNETFFETVRAGFSAPRKQLRNSLSQGLGISTQEASDLLDEAGIDVRRRAETLELREWANLSEVFDEYRTRVRP